MKFLNKKVNLMCSAYNIAECHQFPRNSVMDFQNICDEIGWPRFFAPPCIINLDFQRNTAYDVISLPVVLYRVPMPIIDDLSVCEYTE